ncbi:AAEL003186-PA [Aedes aegypti]|uniref:AAEL003186-PA n=1 Tax=Aedes aegypti TaxID=7159 RepID=Q17G36_AEDAE|nr:AAEL003186-PA [Aedes aegypti]
MTIGDKLLYSFRLQSGPYAEATDIRLTFDYRVEDLILGREFLTIINFTRPDDDLLPNYFERAELNSTHLFMTPVRRSVTSWWLQGDLYGFNEELFPSN